MSFRETLSPFWCNFQQLLLPRLEKELGILSEQHKKLIAILELIRIEEFVPSSRFYEGRPPKDRYKIARAFIAKTVFNIPTTKLLITLLQNDIHLKSICGWEMDAVIPSKDAFARAFKVFSDLNIADRAHKSLVSQVYKNELVMHLTTDSTPIVAREKAPKSTMSRKERKKMQDKLLREKKKNGTSRRKNQLSQSLEDMITELPKTCDIGMKIGSTGYSKVWKGYKLHSTVDDYGVPIAALVTSASLNDSEVAIPLAKQSARLVTSCYELMDAAYDEKEIKEHSLSLGRIAIIDSHSRSKKQKEEKHAEYKRRKLINHFPAEQTRYKERFSKERFNGTIKDYYGGRNIYYRGHAKVTCHLMFGILAYTATVLINLIQ